MSGGFSLGSSVFATFDEPSAGYKWNILERAVKTQIKKKKNPGAVWSGSSLFTHAVLSEHLLLFSQPLGDDTKLPTRIDLSLNQRTKMPYNMYQTTYIHTYIAPGKSGSPDSIFFISPRKHVVGTHEKHLGEQLLLLSTQSVCFVEKEKYQYFTVEKKFFIHSYAHMLICIGKQNTRTYEGWMMRQKCFHQFHRNRMFEATNSWYFICCTDGNYPRAFRR